MSISNPTPEEWLDVAAVRDGDDGASTLPVRIERGITVLIERGSLRAGGRLPSERELARIFGVSRLAVREAAHRLEARGLVVVRRGAGSFVASSAVEAKLADVPPPPAGDVDELSDVRLLLEPAAADWAARRAGRSSKALLVRIARGFEKMAGEPEPRFNLLAAADIELHVEIAQAADNATLAQLIEQLCETHRVRLEWGLRRPARLAQTAVEHRRLVDAIVVGDPAAARDAMIVHLKAAAASLRALPARGGSAAD
jgi:GntR family transcriptional repressor for pyruvate dehydrogenase complex